MSNKYVGRKTDKEIFGRIRGQVEDRSDPLRLGRVRVRIPMLHGLKSSENSIKTGDLPWAMPSMSVPCGQDFGQYLVPPLGSWVWLECEEGSAQKLVYVGSYWDMSDKEVTYSSSNSDIAEIKSDAKPRQIQDQFTQSKSLEPTKDILYKSLKGATIVIEEADEKESFSLIDRLGQTIALISPTKKDCTERRGVKQVISLEPVSSDNSYQNRSMIVLKDAAGQYLRFDTLKDDESIEIVSCSNQFSSSKKSKKVLSFRNSSKGDGILLQSQNGGTLTSVKLQNVPTLGLAVEVSAGGQSMFSFKVTPEKTHLFSSKPIVIDTLSSYQVNCDSYEVRSRHGIMNNVLPAVQPAVPSQPYQVTNTEKFLYPSEVTNVVDSLIANQDFSGFDRVFKDSFSSYRDLYSSGLKTNLINEVFEQITPKLQRFVAQQLVTVSESMGFSDMLRTNLNSVIDRTLEDVFDTVVTNIDVSASVSASLSSVIQRRVLNNVAIEFELVKANVIAGLTNELMSKLNVSFTSSISRVLSSCVTVTGLGCFGVNRYNLEIDFSFVSSALQVSQFETFYLKSLNQVINSLSSIDPLFRLFDFNSFVDSLTVSLQGALTTAVISKIEEALGGFRLPILSLLR